MALKDKLVNLEDLKVVNDVVTDLKNATTSIGQIEYVEYDGYINTSGTINLDGTASNGTKTTNFIPCSDGDVFEFELTFTENQTELIAYAFYTSDGSYVFDSRVVAYNMVSDAHFGFNISIPTAAKFVRISYRTFNVSSPTISQFTHNNNVNQNAKNIDTVFSQTAGLANMSLMPFLLEWDHGGISTSDGTDTEENSKVRSRTNNYYHATDYYSITNNTLNVGYVIRYIKAGNTYTFLDAQQLSAKGGSYTIQQADSVWFRVDARTDVIDAYNGYVLSGYAKSVKQIESNTTRIAALESADGAFLKNTKSATSGSTFDARSSFTVDPSTLSGKTVKIRYECTASMFPSGLYWISGNGKYLSGSAQLYMPNTDYYVQVGNSFATSGNNYSGLYGDSTLVSGSGSVTLYFYTEFNASKNYTQYEIDTIGQFVPIPQTDLLCWGDSLTAGAGGEGTTYPKVCASELNLRVRNCGVGGETGNTIAARQGGNSVVIPAGAVNGTYSTLKDIYGTTIAPLLQGNGSGSASKIYINGDECSISYANSVYTISGYTKGTSSVPLLGRFAGSSFHGAIVTIWCGANGSNIGGDTSVTSRIAIINSMIRNIGHDHFVVFTNWKANGIESDFTEDDAAMLKEYGNKLFPARKMLVDYGLTLMGVTPTAQDETDIANGTIPTSLRSDSVHLNADGYTAVGKFLADKIRSLGYVD